MNHVIGSIPVIRLFLLLLCDYCRYFTTNIFKRYEIIRIIQITCINNNYIYILYLLCTSSDLYLSQQMEEMLVVILHLVVCRVIVDLTAVHQQTHGK